MMPTVGLGLLVAVLLLGGPIVIGLDAWRFPGDAWRVAGHRYWQWVSRLLPIALVGMAFLPFGVWWFRSAILIADASCVPYLVRVRPMLRLANLLETDPRLTVRLGASAATVRVEPQPAHRSVRSTVREWFSGSGYTSSGVDENLPRVVAVNRRDEERVLFTKPTWEEAVEASGRVSDDLLDMGLDRWRRYYGVPADFLE